MGALSLGLSASLLRQAVYGTARIGLHRSFSSQLVDWNAGQPVSFAAKTAAGMLSGALAVVLGSPMDVALVPFHPHVSSEVESDDLFCAPPPSRRPRGGGGLGGRSGRSECRVTLCDLSSSAAAIATQSMLLPASPRRKACARCNSRPRVNGDRRFLRL
jgi:hypothetical protein